LGLRVYESGFGVLGIIIMDQGFTR